MSKNELEEIINSPISTIAQREQAAALLSSLKPAPAPAALPAGNVTLRYGNDDIVVSPKYATELAKTHGNVHSKASTDEALLVLLLSQLYFSDDSARCSAYSARRAEDTARFPEREKNYKQIFKKKETA